MVREGSALMYPTIPASSGAVGYPLSFVIPGCEKASSGAVFCFSRWTIAITIPMTTLINAIVVHMSLGVFMCEVCCCQIGEESRDDWKDAGGEERDEAGKECDPDIEAG